ncbi:MAG: hypothetical protein U0M78_10995 [Sellimonas sp.]|nr:hypothetical protein [Sellimonas sp.]
MSRILAFNVVGQQIKKDPECDFDNIVSGTSGYLYARFTFSREWAGTVKVAEFRQYVTDDCYPVKIVNGICEIPKEVLSGRYWHVTVVGKHGELKLTTGKEKVMQEV